MMLSQNPKFTFGLFFWCIRIGTCSSALIFWIQRRVSYKFGISQDKSPIADNNIVRKELNSAVLLAELMTTVQSALEIQFDSIQAFTESTVVLVCIKSDANRRKTYVKNPITPAIR